MCHTVNHKFYVTTLGLKLGLCVTTGWSHDIACNHLFNMLKIRKAIFE